jgi:hypothetical protein
MNEFRPWQANVYEEGSGFESGKSGQFGAAAGKNNCAGLNECGQIRPAYQCKSYMCVGRHVD